MTYQIEAKGLDGFREVLEALGAAVEPAAALALNEAARYGRRLGSEQIRREVNLKAGYIDAGRLQVTRRADASNLEAVITARDRPTSLARFGQGSPRFGAQRVAPRVRVKASGGSSTLKRGFYLRLRRGNSVVSSENANIGLAIRLKEGERVENKSQMASIGDGVYLLYAPSVGQVFRGVSERIAEDVGIQAANRFAHHIGRRLNV